MPEPESPGEERTTASVRRAETAPAHGAPLLRGRGDGDGAFDYLLPRRHAAAVPGMPAVPPVPRPILELEGEELERELDALTEWVDGFLIETYGAEVSAAAPWCTRWQEHTDVVAWLHALWMAYQQHKEPDAGLSGMAVWHRDVLTHVMAAVRAPTGPLSACMTSPDREDHRVLPGPPRSTRTGTDDGDREPEEESGGEGA